MVSYTAILCNIMECFSHKEEERSNVPDNTKNSFSRLRLEKVYYLS